MIRWCLDLDNTLVRTEGTDYKNATPIPEAVAKVQGYKRRGDHIIIMTARGSGSKKDWREFTKKQLLGFGIPFDQLIVGLKPGGVDFFVDDKAINALDWLADEERAMSRVETEDQNKDVQIFDPYFPYAAKILKDLGIDPIKIESFLKYEERMIGRNEI